MRRKHKSQSENYCSSVDISNILVLKLSFIAERPPPPHIAHQELLMAAKEIGEYF